MKKTDNGYSANQGMITHLGGCLNPDKLQSIINHPSERYEKMQYFLCLPHDKISA